MSFLRDNIFHSEPRLRVAFFWHFFEFFQDFQWKYCFARLLDFNPLLVSFISIYKDLHHELLGFTLVIWVWHCMYVKVKAWEILYCITQYNRTPFRQADIARENPVYTPCLLPLVGAKLVCLRDKSSCLHAQFFCKLCISDKSSPALAKISENLKMIEERILSFRFL